MPSGERPCEKRVDDDRYALIFSVRFCGVPGRHNTRDHPVGPWCLARGPHEATPHVSRLIKLYVNRTMAQTAAQLQELKGSVIEVERADYNDYILPLMASQLWWTPHRRDRSRPFLCLRLRASEVVSDTPVRFPPAAGPGARSARGAAGRAHVCSQKLDEQYLSSTSDHRATTSLTRDR